MRPLICPSGNRQRYVRCFVRHCEERLIRRRTVGWVERSDTNYDATGNVTAATDPNRLIKTMAYDSARRLLTTTAPPPFNVGSNLVQTTNTYDADGHLTAVARSNGATNQIVSTSYTPTGNISAVTDANNNPPTTRTYDLNDRLQSVTQPVSPGISRLTRFNYATLNRLVSVIDNTGNMAEQYSYTPNGKLATFADARGNTITYTFDGFDRLSHITYRIGNTGSHTSESFT